MPLYLEILKEIQDKHVPEEFKVGDLIKKPTSNNLFKVGDQVYALSTLRTMLANLAIDKKDNSFGHHVQHAEDAKYIRVSRGLYRLNYNPEQLHAPVVSDENAEQTIQDNRSELIQFDIKLTTAPNNVAAYVVDYLQRVPFQYFFKKQNKTHPKKPAQGLNERLNAYFWPDLSVSWHSTQQEIQSYVTQFRSIECNKDQPDTAEKLLALFSKICRWGGVKLPSISAADLKLQVFSVLDILDNGGVPDNNFTINSAYTKLYAIARPDSFIIFDSRVAAALTSIIDSKYHDLVSLPDWSKYKNLGFVNGRGGSRPRLLLNKWKNGYQKWSAQISANMLCQDIISIINTTPLHYGFAQAITLRELEAILFMEGY